MSTPRTIRHADTDAFYAVIEQRDDPALGGRLGGGWRRRSVDVSARPQ